MAEPSIEVRRAGGEDWAAWRGGRLGHRVLDEIALRKDPDGDMLCH